MKIVSGLISRRILDMGKQVIIPFQEQPLTTMLQEVLVWQKRGWHWVNTNEIGDGSQVVYVCKRPYLATKLNKEWLLRGMSLYQEYDEIENSMQTYLYKFSKDDRALETVQNFLDTRKVGYQVMRKDRFVVLEGDPITFGERDTTLIQLTHAGHGGLLSFLCGLVIAYGNIDQEDEVLHTIHISLPLIGSVAERSFLLDRMVYALRDIGIFVGQRIQDQNHGQVMQLMVTDWEALNIIGRWLHASHAITEMSKYETYKSMKVDLVRFLEKESNTGYVREKVDYGVVKLLKKG